MFIKNYLQKVFTPKYLIVKHANSAMGKVGLTFSGVGPNVTKRIQIWPKCPYRTYIVDEKLIEIVVKQISEDLKTENAFIFEASPGRGKLTKALLEAGAQRIRAFVDEGGHKFIDDLKDLESKYPSNLEICDSDLIEINRTIKKDSLKGTSTLPALFASVPIHSWSDPLPVKMIIPLTPIIETKFLRPLFIQMAHLTGIFTCGRAQILTFVSCYEYSYMKGNAEQRNLNNYRSSSVLYNTFFDVEFLAEVPWDCFEPKIGTNSNKLKKQKVSSAFMVRLTPRKDLPEKLPTIYWLDYIFFVQQAMTKRTAYILAFLEKWAPGCGPKLIKFGIPHFSRFGDLNPHQFLDLFCELITWEEFSFSNFRMNSEIHE